MGTFNLANVLSSAETIKGQRLKNQLGQQQMSNNQLLQQKALQFNPLAQNFLQSPTQENFAAAAAVDPQAAQQLAQTVGAGQDVQQGQSQADQGQAQQIVASMDTIMRSKSPRKMISLLFPPEKVKEFEEQSGEVIEDWDDTELAERVSLIRDQALTQTGADFLAQRGDVVATQQKAALDAVAEKEKMSKLQFEQLDKLVNSAKKDKRVDDFIQISTAFDRIATAGNTPAGDISMIFAFMKMLDPGSTVREGEFATAQNATGIPGRVQAAYNKAIGGTGLTPTLRADFKGQAKAIFDKSRSTADKAVKPFEGRAKRFGLRAETVRESVFGVPEDVPEGMTDNGDGTFTLPNGDIVRRKQ